MQPDPADRFQRAADVANAIEGMMARALIRDESRLTRVFANAVGIFGVLVAVLCAVVTWMLIPSLRELGMAALTFIVVAAAGLSCSVVEWRTDGRHDLGQLALVCALSTFLLGLATWATGMGNVFTWMKDPEHFATLDVWRDGLTTGSYEAIGNLSASATFAVLQLMVWAVTQRAIRRKRAASQQPG